MAKKRIIRCVAFLLCFALMLFALCDLFGQDNNTNHAQRYYTYTQLEKDTVDAVVIGTSGIDRYWIAAQAYEDYGMTVYPLATDAFPVWLYIDVIEHALQYQNPELLILDIRPFGQDNTDIKDMETRAHRQLDIMPFFSINRIKGALKTMQIMRERDENATKYDISYLLSFIKYHNKWKDDDYRFYEQLGSTEHNQLGFFMWKKFSIKRAKIKAVKYDASHTEPLDPIAEETLYEIIDYIKKKNINVLFIDTPQVRPDIDAGRSNTVYKVLEENNLPYVHWFSEKSKTGISMDLDLKADFYNEGHTNFYGASKFTAEFSKYLDKNYDLPDRREDERAQADWAGVYDSVLDKMAIYEEEKES